MKVFIWQSVEDCIYSYNRNGGVVVFADTEKRAREMANAILGCKIHDKEKPDEVRDCADGDERVFIIPTI